MRTGVCVCVCHVVHLIRISLCSVGQISSVEQQLFLIVLLSEVGPLLQIEKRRAVSSP